MKNNLTHKEKSDVIIKALEHERGLFIKKGQSTKDHDLTIEFLKTGNGEVEDVDKYELLEAAVNDFETLYDDYKDYKTGSLI